MGARSEAAGYTRRRLIATGTGLAITSTVVAAGPGTASADRRPRDRRSSLSPADLAEIYHLKVQYAFGSDQIVAGRFEEGRELYRAAFWDDAEVSGGFDEASPVFTATGPDDLAETIRGLVGGSIASQHLIGTIEIVEGERNGRHKTADVTAYVQATSLMRATAEVQRVLATYYDVAERRAGQWKMSRSFAQYVSVEAPAARLAP
jgi:hypothetical protein